MTTPELLAAYLAGADALAPLLGALTPEQLRSRPVAGTWSPLELVSHLADSDALFAHRMKRVLAEDRPELPLADPDRYSAALAYQERYAREEVAFVVAVRRRMARILAAQPPEAWRRVGIHSKEGGRSLEQLLRKAVDHLEHHLTFLREKCRALEG